MRNNFICFILVLIALNRSVFCYEVKKADSTLQKASKIKLIALDVDGVLTNGEIAYISNGDEIRIFNVKDGLGLFRASQNGFITAIITGGASPMVEKRGEQLNIHHVYQNTKDKFKAIEELAHKCNLNFEEICYIGDDLPDIPVLKVVGLSCCPLDAVSEVKELCEWISSYEGGKGAMRELTDFLLASKKIEKLD